ncbi:biofilm development regulator YmgB/AriR family protein [Pantoea stewartii]|nr:biofilm development regulator YmgB/AriR family protein [Pantoea stewartii]
MSAFLQSFDERYDEKRVLSQSVVFLLARSGRVSRKAILLYLIAEIQGTQDVIRLDVLRSCLELVTRPADSKDI